MNTAKIAGIFLIVAGPLIFGLEKDSPGDVRIKEFRVQGLERTKPSVIEPYYLPYEGRPYSETVRNEIIQDLRSLGIFHSIEVVPGPPENSEVIVRIYIEEKWTLVPIPLAGASAGGKVYGGLMVLESNLFGYNKKMYGGGIVSTEGWKALLGYIDPNFFGSRNSLFLGFNAGTEEVKNETPDERIYRQYNALGFNAAAEYAWKLNDLWALGLGGEFQDRSLITGYPRALDEPENVSVLGPGFSLKYQDYFFDRILVYGIQGQVKYEHKFFLTGTGLGYPELSYLLLAHKLVFSKHRLSLRSRGVLSPDTPGPLENRLTEQFFKTLPEGVSAASYAGIQGAFEYTAVDFSWGALTFLAFYEGGFFNREKEAFQSTHGPGGGIRLYLSRVAVPAFGFDFSYNMKTGNPYARVNIGMQM
jgi:hypothetical protein